MPTVTVDASLERTVIETVTRAAQLIKDSPFRIDEKAGPVNIVTTNDVACQQFLYKELSPLIPGAGFLGEESLMEDLNHEYLWIIDPIDGTANYSRGINECAISVALVQGKEPLLGVVYNIFTGEVFSARRGAGARRSGKPIAVSGRDFAAGLLCTAMSVYNKALAKTCSDIIYDAYMECNDVRRFGGCALELCYLAAGRCDLYFEMRVFPWDFAAGYLIFTEGGGFLSGLDGKAPTLSGPTVLIGGNTAENHKKMCEIVQKHMTCVPYKA